MTYIANERYRSLYSQIVAAFCAFVFCAESFGVFIFIVVVESMFVE